MTVKVMMRRAIVLSSIVVATVVLWVAAFHVAVFTHGVASELERADALAELSPKPQATTVFDRAGTPAFTFFLEQRVDVTLDRVSPRMLDAIVAIEDQRFYMHHGLDPVRIAGSAWNNMRANKIVQGGSTITQQLARAAQQLSPKRTYERKIREAMIASRLEQRYSKSQILEAYLNAVYFGEGYYGVEAAARGYFGKPASALETHEAALLAAVVRAPSHDAPRVSPVRAKARRNLVLRRMRDQGRLAESEYATAVAASIPGATRPAVGSLVARGGSGIGQYFEEELRRQLVAQFGNERVLRGGLRVYSTYDPRLQQAAEKAITTRIAQIAASRPKARDLQGSLVAMDPKTGDVLAIVGGRDFRASQYNRATQARRQAGSAFKPLLYAAALERGFAPGTMLKDLDSPILTAGESWLPAGDHEKTEYTLRRALKVSSNRAAAQLMQQVGTSTTAYYAQRLGIESPMPMVPSLALGTGEVTLLELTSAYTAFANRGITSTPRLYTRVEDAKGTALYFHEERHVQAISPSTAYMMSSMLADVISSGTGTAARGAGFKLPAAGKTGTTDDYADAWFVGYTPHIVAGVWFGLDRPAPIMARGFGGTVAVPAWATFMKDATAGAKPDWYDMPADLEKVAICPLSGGRATDACRYHAMPAAVPVAAVATEDLLDADGLSIAPALPVEAPRAVVVPRAKVYEDIFPIGAVPSEPCPLHDPAGQPGDLLGTTGAGAPATPIVDEALQLTSADVGHVAPPAATVRSANPRIFVDRVVGSDGVVRTVMRQR